MILVADLGASQAMWEGQPVQAIYAGTGTEAVQVWSNGPAEVWVPITGINAGDVSRDQARAAATSRGIDWATATTVPFGFDCSGAKAIGDLLRDWSKLTKFRIRNTGQVTSATSMFLNCSSLTSIPAMDTSSLTYTYGMFWSCSSLTSIPAMDTSKVYQASYMFRGCSSLTTVPALDMSALDASGMNGAFDLCPSLTSIGIYGIKVSFSVANTQLGAAALNTLFSNLGTANAGATINITGTPGAATCNRSLATAKGWTVTG